MTALVRPIEIRPFTLELLLDPPEPPNSIIGTIGVSRTTCYSIVAFIRRVLAKLLEMMFLIEYEPTISFSPLCLNMSEYDQNTRALNPIPFALHQLLDNYIKSEFLTASSAKNLDVYVSLLRAFKNALISESVSPTNVQTIYAPSKVANETLRAFMCAIHEASSITPTRVAVQLWNIYAASSCDDILYVKLQSGLFDDLSTFCSKSRANTSFGIQLLFIEYRDTELKRLDN